MLMTAAIFVGASAAVNSTVSLLKWARAVTGNMADRKHHKEHGEPQRVVMAVTIGNVTVHLKVTADQLKEISSTKAWEAGVDAYEHLRGVGAVHHNEPRKEPNDEPQA
jgi:hypothetical protein